MKKIPKIQSLPKTYLKLYKEYRPHLKNRINCETCGKILDVEDKNQKQHIFPEWKYNLIPDRNTVNEPEVLAVPISEPFNIDKAKRATIQPKSTFSNIWCVNCEKKSSFLDSWAKKTMFGKYTKLKPGLIMFDVYKNNSQYRIYKKRLKRKKIKLFNRDNVNLYRWLSSLVLRQLIVDYGGDEFDSLKKSMYKAMIDGFQNFDIFIAIDETRFVDTIGTLTMIGEEAKESAHLILQFGGLIAIFVNFGIKNQKIVFTDYELKKTVELNKIESRKTTIKIVKNLTSTAFLSLTEEKRKGRLSSFSDSFHIVLRKS